MAKRPRLFYGWIIVSIAVLSITVIYGIRHSFAVFFPSILDEFGWSRGSTAMMFSINLLVYGFVAPLVGGLGDRWKPRRVMPIGVIILSLATAGCAFANELWHFYLLFGILVPLGTALSGWPILCPALSNWFAKRRGLVMGLGQAGVGFSFVYGIFVEFVISQLGWRSAYFTLAGTLLVLPLPLYLLLFHYRPEDKGLKAYGTTKLSTTKDSAVEVATDTVAVSYDWTFVQAIKTYQLWLLVLGLLLYWGMGVYPVLAHQIKFAEDIGYSSRFAASVFALFGIGTVAGSLSSSISDWIGREKTVTVAATLSIGALVALILVNDTSQPWLLYVYAICFGYGAALYAGTNYAAVADIFHGRHFGAIAGLLLTGAGIGTAIGPSLAGHIYDVSGSYLGAFILSMVSIGVAYISFWMAAPRNAAKLRAKNLGMPQR